jgi:Right handed beta helix region
MTARRMWIPGLLLLAGPAQGVTLHVPSEHPTVQSALDAAAAGDTVLVAPGRYQELIILPAGVALLSSDGPDSTVLVTTGLAKSLLDERVLEVAEGADRSTVLQGFAFDRNGIRGTAIYCENASPTIRGNRITGGFSFGINVRDGSPLIEGNEIADCTTFGISIFASSPEIVNNVFHDCQSRAIEVSGVKSKPVIGGAVGKENHFYANTFDIINSSMNDIDATHNDWGWATTAEMDTKPWPADIAAIGDGNDHKKPVGRGVVDYRNWVESRPAASALTLSGNRWLLPVLVLAGLALVVAVIVRR